MEAHGPWARHTSTQQASLAGPLQACSRATDPGWSPAQHNTSGRSARTLLRNAASHAAFTRVLRRDRLKSGLP
jgi:hypothetical protein